MGVPGTPEVGRYFRRCGDSESSGDTGDCEVVSVTDSGEGEVEEAEELDDGGDTEEQEDGGDTEEQEGGGDGRMEEQDSVDDLLLSSEGDMDTENIKEDETVLEEEPKEEAVRVEVTEKVVDEVGMKDIATDEVASEEEVTEESVAEEVPSAEEVMKEESVTVCILPNNW